MTQYAHVSCNGQHKINLSLIISLVSIVKQQHIIPVATCMSCWKPLLILQQRTVVQLHELWLLIFVEIIISSLLQYMSNDELGTVYSILFKRSLCPSGVHRTAIHWSVDKGSSDNAYSSCALLQKELPSCISTVRQAQSCHTVNIYNYTCRLKGHHTTQSSVLCSITSSRSP